MVFMRSGMPICASPRPLEVSPTLPLRQFTRGRREKEERKGHPRDSVHTASAASLRPENTPAAQSCLPPPPPPPPPPHPTAPHPHPFFLSSLGQDWAIDWRGGGIDGKNWCLHAQGDRQFLRGRKTPLSGVRSVTFDLHQSSCRVTAILSPISRGNRGQRQCDWNLLPNQILTN